MQINHSNPYNSFKCLIDNIVLFKQLSKRNIISRYKGSILGIIWALITPLVMLAIYSFVFTVVFKARWGVDNSDTKGQFAIILFSGLIIHAFFAECISRVPTLIIENTNFVKKVIFPLEILVPTMIMSSLFQFLVSFLVLLCGVIYVSGAIHLTIFLLPIILLPFILMTFGISWFLSSLGVYIRDISHIMGVLVTVLLFMSTIFYPVSALPIELQEIIYLNPLSFIVDQFREVVLYGNMPNWNGLAIYSIISIIVYFCGFWWFQKTRRGFSDVL